MNTTKCPTCNAPSKMTWSGLDLVTESGDETLASKHYEFDPTGINLPVSGKRPSVDEINKFLDDYGFVVPYDGSDKFYDNDKIKHAKAGIEFVMNFLDKEKAACASGAVDKTVSEGDRPQSLLEGLMDADLGRE